MEWVKIIFSPAVVWVLIPLTVLTFLGLQQLAKLYFNHQERMALIDQGIHPDDPTQEAEQESLT